jgi:hypothetical protein
MNGDSTQGDQAVNKQDFATLAGTRRVSSRLEASVTAQAGKVEQVAAFACNESAFPACFIKSTAFAVTAV